MEAFEQMRRRGKIEKSALAQFGISLSGLPAEPIREIPDQEMQEDNAETRNLEGITERVSQGNPITSE